MTGKISMGPGVHWDMDKICLLPILLLVACGAPFEPMAETLVTTSDAAADVVPESAASDAGALLEAGDALSSLDATGGDAWQLPETMSADGGAEAAVEAEAATVAEPVPEAGVDAAVDAPETMNACTHSHCAAACQEACQNTLSCPCGGDKQETTCATACSSIGAKYNWSPEPHLACACFWSP